MEYRAIYSGDSLSHGKFKYIDKWKSKAGNWVYKYAEDMNEAIQNARNQYNRTHRDNVIRPHSRDENRNNSGGWHTANDQDSIAGYSQTRERTVTNAQGQKIRRKEYRSEAENANANRNIKFTNAMRKDHAGKLGAAIMDLNDKYGPKEVYAIEAGSLSGGRRYVMYVTRNAFGGREVSAETYSYNPNEDRVLRKKKVRKANRRAKNGVKERR